MSATPTASPAEAPPAATSLEPASSGRRVVAWLIDIVIVAALVGVVYLLGLIKINGCDTWDPSTQQFGGSCPFESTREVTRPDGSVDLVYVLDSGRELPADHPTVKTVLLGTRIVDPPSAATYLVGLGYVLVVYLVVQGALGWTPGKLLAGVRLARDDGRRAGVPGAFVRWLVIDGFIGVFGVVMGLIDAWWPLRLLAADAALLLVGGVVALVAGGRQPGDRLAGTLVVDEAALASRRASMREAAAPAEPTAPGLAPAPDAAAAAGATFVVGPGGQPEAVAVPAPAPAAGDEAAPTPLPQWPTSTPGRPVEEEPTPTAAPAEAPAPTGAPAPTEAPGPGATPLGASVGAAPSALRPRPLEPSPDEPPVEPVEPGGSEPAAEAPTGTAAASEPEPDALVTTTMASASPAVTTTGEADLSGATEAESAPPVRQPEWDEARRAYIFWDDSRQEWLQYFEETQSWGPITRA